MSKENNRMPPAEPAWITERFERDPLGAARDTLLGDVRDAASAGITGQTILRDAREAMGLRLAAELCPDEEVQNKARDKAMELVTLVSTHPSASMLGVGVKLALLVQDLMPSTGHGLETGEAAVRLYLAASALADCVIIGDRAIELPRDIGELIENEHDVARLRARARYVL